MKLYRSVEAVDGLLISPFAWIMKVWWKGTHRYPPQPGVAYMIRIPGYHWEADFIRQENCWHVWYLCFDASGQSAKAFWINHIRQKDL